MTALDLKSNEFSLTGGAGFLGRQVLKQLCKLGRTAEDYSAAIA